MKLGVAGLLPHWQEIDAAAARRVRAAGFSGASVFIDRPLEAERSDIVAVKKAFDAAGLAVAQVNGWYEALVNPDEARRRDGIRGMRALCRWGRALQAGSVYVRPGSLNPAGHWWPHPRNHDAETFDRLTDSLGQVCSAAVDEGVVVAVEGHVVSPLDTAATVRRLIEAVDSPALRFNIDVVNFVGTVRDAHDPRRVTDALFDTLGQYAAALHAKDCAVRDAHVLHIDEVLLGTGAIDHERVLRLFEQCCPDGFVIIEHLPDELVPAARTALLAAAARAGIELAQ